MHRIDRRAFLIGSAAVAAGATSSAAAAAGAGAGDGQGLSVRPPAPRPPSQNQRARRRYALNPPTVKGYGLSLGEQVRLAAEAGFDGIEPWLKDIHAARKAGLLKDAVRRAKDSGLEFVNGIAFGAWAVDDAAQRAAGMEETKRDMAALAEIGCPRIAASMFGAQKAGGPKIPLERIAERYAAVCDLGKEMGVRPLLEYWGHSANLNTPEEALYAAALANRTSAGVLADVYHTHRGGGSFATFRFFSPATLPVLHTNDYPAEPEAKRLTDADRIWPGDGAAPWRQIFAALDETGTNPWLSIELFNPNYWKTNALETMRTALAKMKGVAE